jgi:hypothetical protein
MTGLVEVCSQKIISLVEEGPSVDYGEASELVYLCITDRCEETTIRSAENQEQTESRDS